VKGSSHDSDGMQSGDGLGKAFDEEWHNYNLVVELRIYVSQRQEATIRITIL